VEGAALVGVDIDADALERMAVSVRASGGHVSTLSADVAEEATAEIAVARAMNSVVSTCSYRTQCTTCRTHR
jgi:hypothetical protein